MKISTRMILLLVAGVMAVMGVYALVTISRSHDRLNEEVVKMADHVSLALSVGVLHHLEEGDVSGVEDVLEMVTHHEDVIGAAVFDPQGKLVAVSSSLAGSVPKVYPSVMAEDGQGWYGEGEDGAQIYTYIHAIHGKGHAALGAMKLVLGQKSLLPFVVEARNFVLGAIFFLTVVLSLLIVVFTQKQIAAPLANLTQGAEVLGQGQLDYRLEGKERGEIGILAAAFNQMAANLQAATQDIIAEREYIRSIVDSLVEGVVVVDKDLAITVWNRTMEQRHGLSLEQVTGKRIVDVLPDLKPYGLTLSASEVLKGEKTDFELSTVPAEGIQERLLVVNGVPLKDNTAQTVGVVLVLTDVTAKVRLEEQIQRSEKLAAVGQLAAGVAHEIGTPLNVISGSAEYLMMDLEDGQSSKEELGIIVSEANRITTLLKQFMAFARPETPVGEPIALDQIIDSTLVLLRRQLEQQGVEVEIEIDQGTGAIKGDRNQIQQVLLNLIINAWQAMPDGGTLSIKGGTIEPWPTRDGATDEQAPSIGVELQIEDTGVGIPAENLAKVFEPFYTTKDVGQGTGLGLAVIQRIVENHGGTVHASSQPGKGSRFTVVLPAFETA